ncbi:hypothetical protein ANCCEY_08893 [Ancylostoma ceylanicum]|uniref:Uncharacterized protein n=1 Tax=Ancylostoma ceylanicum TaxID=53326 RepID=A0A0D6LIY2_9BILA|nr:hypothetical protein ANCCEY_08893 [Ancylostoma ceylanicum]
MAWLQPEPMEPIPEEGTEDAAEWTLSPTSSGRRTTRKREIFTSEQVDTLVRSASRAACRTACLNSLCCELSAVLRAVVPPSSNRSPRRRPSSGRPLSLSLLFSFVITRTRVCVSCARSRPQLALFLTRFSDT